MEKRRATKKIFCMAAFVLFLGGFLLSLGMRGGNAEAAEITSSLPIVYVNTEDGVDITSKEKYVNATMTIQGNETWNTNLYDGPIEIRGRGNATWGNPKKPYKVKLDSSSDLFGMGKSKHWVLLANYVDSSLLRNKVSYDFSGAMGMPYMQSVHVELVLNGKHLGNYQFCEQVKLEEDRVNVEGVESKVKEAAKAISKAEGLDKDALEDAMNEDMAWITSDSLTFEGKTYRVSDYYGPIDITGGFLLELDYYDDEVSQIITSTGKRVKFKDPEYAVTNKEMYGYVADYLNAFEAAIHAKDFRTVYQGEELHYSELFDMDSLVKFWLVQEIFFNWDGMNNSNYIYKDVGGLMHFGPIWDMDLTSGSGGTGSTSTWQTFGFDFWQHPDQWYRSVTKDPFFIVRAYQYYHEIRDTLIEDMRAQILSLGEEIGESAQINLDMWHSGGKYTSKVKELYDWMTRHLEWMDEQFESPETMIESLGRNAAYGYAPDQGIEITVTDMGEEISVSSADAGRVKCYVNGKEAGTEELVNGKAEFQIPKELLTTDGTLNAVQAFAVEEDGTLGTSNFAAFESEILPDVLTGEVTISGNPVVSAILSVKTNALNDPAVTYQWLADGKPIPGASDVFYRITPDMEGKKISVSVTGSETMGSIVSEMETAVALPAVQKDHLIINQVYGGGGASGVPVSHDFIEIYNPTEKTVDLSQYRLGYLSNRKKDKTGSTGGAIAELALTGRLRSGMTCLIRCAANDTSGTDPVLKIEKFDVSWEGRVIDNKQYQVMLRKDGSLIDGLSVNEEALEGVPFQDPEGDEILSKNKSVRRIGYQDSDKNTADFEVLNLTKLPAEMMSAVRPDSLADHGLTVDSPEPEDPKEDKTDDKTPDREPDIRKPGRLNAQKLDLQKGQSAKVLKLEYAAVPGDKIISWSSSDPRRVKIHKKTGKMTGRAIGSAVVTATLKSGEKISCKIRVIKKPVATKSYKLNKTKLVLKKGKSFQIRLKNRMPLTANDKVTYRSSNPGTVTVSAKGKVKAKAKGSAGITVKTGGRKARRIKITVK